MELLRVWGEFSIVSILILISGYFLCIYGDAIADKTNLGRTWVGAILLATVTSLPELAAGISAVTVTDAPDLVVGELLGSCVFNLMIIVLLDSLYRKSSVFLKVERAQIVCSAFGVVLIGFVGLNILLSRFLGFVPIAHLGWYSLVIPVLYFSSMKELFSYEADHKTQEEEPNGKYAHFSLVNICFRYFIAAVVVVGAGIYLPVVGQKIVAIMGWNEAFVGTLFVALTTSLPEAAVTVSALSIGAVDLAFGNLVGSNLFNILILPICDFFYFKGPILSNVSEAHVITALSAVVMSALAILGIINPPKKKMLGLLSWVSILLILFYLLNTYAIFSSNGSVG